MFWYNLPIDNAVPERVTFLVTTSLFKQQQKIGGLENFDKRPSKIEILITLTGERWEIRCTLMLKENSWLRCRLLQCPASSKLYTAEVTHIQPPGL